MDYEKIYRNIIDKRKRDIPVGYSEMHHIIPRSLGGSDAAENLVRLTAREHFICHMLLVRMYTRGSQEWIKMVHAAMMMFTHSSNQQRYITSREYNSLRVDFSKVMSITQNGDGNSQYGTRWIYNPVLRSCKKISTVDDVPDGWFLGRVVDFDKYELKQTQKRDKIAEALNKKQVLIATHSEYHKLYVSVGFNEFCVLTGYTKTHANLVQGFSKYVSGFIPQNGKSRG